MKIKKQIKNIVTFTSVSLFILVLMGVSNSKHEELTITATQIDIDYSHQNYFLEKDQIYSLLYVLIDSSLEGSSVSDFPIDRIENAIQQNAYVKNTRVYVDSKGKLFLYINQRRPVVKVINKKGVSYYLDENGEKMPNSRNFSARVPVSTGFINDNNLDTGMPDSSLIHELFQLADFIDENPFWKAQVEQIYVNEVGEFELIPKVGNHVIELGKIDNLKQKLEDLFIFYKQGLRYVGWYKYKKISLKYNGQIVCTKY